METRTFRAQNKERSTRLEEKNVSFSLMLSLLHLIQAQANCLLCHSDCTIEQPCGCCTRIPYSV